MYLSQSHRWPRLAAVGIRASRSALSWLEIKAEAFELRNTLPGHGAWLAILELTILVTHVQDPAPELLILPVALGDTAVAMFDLELAELLKMLNPTLNVVLGVRFVLGSKVEVEFLQLAKAIFVNK
jgi:hypothetical protein